METLRDLAYGPDERNVLDLYLPDGESDGLPLVVCIHGGGWMSGDKGNWTWAATHLAEEGLAAATLTYRFTPQWLFPAQLDDVQRAVRWLRHHAGSYGIDPSRVGAIGNSAGGHLAAFLGLTDTHLPPADDEAAACSSRVACVVDCYGPVDLVRLMSSASAPIVEQLLGCGLSAETVAGYMAASPAAQITPPVCPFLVVHGTLDVGETRGQVPIDISRRFAERLRAAGGQAEFVAIEGAQHGFMHHPETPAAQQTIRMAAEFFRTHLTRP